MNAIKLFDYDKFVVKQLEEKEDSLKKIKIKRNVKEEEIENEFFDEILKKRKEKKSESVIFKKLERIN